MQEKENTSHSLHHAHLTNQTSDRAPWVRSYLFPRGAISSRCSDVQISILVSEVRSRTSKRRPVIRFVSRWSKVEGFPRSEYGPVLVGSIRCIISVPGPEGEGWDRPQSILVKSVVTDVSVHYGSLTRWLQEGSDRYTTLPPLPSPEKGLVGHGPVRSEYCPFCVTELGRGESSDAPTFHDSRPISILPVYFLLIHKVGGFLNNKRCKG